MTAPTGGQLVSLKNATLAVVMASSAVLYLLRRHARNRKPCKRIPMSCACGQVKFTTGVDLPIAGNLVCHCMDCQKFNRILVQRRQKLRQQVPSVEFFDPNTGGVHLAQVYRAHVKLQAGGRLLRVCKLHANTHLSRVYSSCCHSPIFNVFGEAFGETIPVMTVFPAYVQGNDDEHTFGRKKDYIFCNEALGPVVAFPAGESRAHDKVGGGLVLKLIKHMLIGLFLGLGSPSPMSLATNKTAEIC